MKSLQNRADIELLVNTFYDRARQHPELGPIFNDHIGNLWDLHLDTMYRFWETLLFDETQSYHGAPFPKHVELPIAEHHFDQWMSLFVKTINDLFEGEKAEQAKVKARNIINAFRRKFHKMDMF